MYVGYRRVRVWFGCRIFWGLEGFGFEGFDLSTGSSALDSVGSISSFGGWGIVITHSHTVTHVPLYRRASGGNGRGEHRGAARGAHCCARF